MELQEQKLVKISEEDFWDLATSVMTSKIKTKNYPQDFQNLVDFLIELFVFVYTFCNQNRQHE